MFPPGTAAFEALRRRRQTAGDPPERDPDALPVSSVVRTDEGQRVIIHEADTHPRTACAIGEAIVSNVIAEVDP